MPDFTHIPAHLIPWLWCGVIASSAFAVVGKALNAIGKKFVECPHCNKIILHNQTVCNHCFRRR